MRALFKTDREITPGPVPADVLAYWRGKGLQPSFSYKDVWNEEHDLAFSAAKVMRFDVLSALHDELDRAISKGIPFAQWQKEIEGRMQSLGWWAPHEVIDPKTGQRVKVDPPSRLKLIYDTNLRSARAVGQWNRIQKNKRARPYLLYQVGPSIHHREQHLAWQGLLLSVDDPFWTYAFPPNGYNCKCWVRTVSQSEADKLTEIAAPEVDDKGKRTGGSITVPIVRVAPPIALVPWENKRTGRIELVPKGIDPGFHRPPGEGRRAALGSPSVPPAPAAPAQPAPVEPVEPPAPPAPAPESILPTTKPLPQTVVDGVRKAQANGNGRMLLNVAKKIQKAVQKQYALPAPRKLDAGVVFGPGDPEYYKANAYLARYTNGRLVVGLSKAAPDPVKSTVHEAIHTMGGAAAKGYQRTGLHLEEVCTETLAQHFMGRKGTMEVTKPTKTQDLKAWAREFDHEASSRLRVKEGSYSGWRGRLAFAVALAEDKWDAEELQKRVEEVALTWKRTTYDSSDSALEGMLTALAPASDDVRDFYRTVLDRDTWGLP